MVTYFCILLFSTIFFNKIFAQHSPNTVATEWISPEECSSKSPNQFFNVVTMKCSDCPERNLGTKLGRECECEIGYAKVKEIAIANGQLKANIKCEKCSIGLFCCLLTIVMVFIIFNQ